MAKRRKRPQAPKANKAMHTAFVEFRQGSRTSPHIPKPYRKPKYKNWEAE